MTTEDTEEHWRFLTAVADSGTVDLAGDRRLACMAVAVATQSAFAGFALRRIIDIRQAQCPTCKGAGFNTGLGFWMFECGAEIMPDGEECEPCGAAVSEIDPESAVRDGRPPERS